jgi:Ca2+-binding EF-hand superfamily protein
MRPLPPSQWTALQIRESFDLADSDGNGALTRAEAQQLAIMPRSFEDMDENKDGFVSRAEYEASFLAR